MKTSINLYCKNEDTIKKFSVIKNLGYDEFFTGINDRNETLSLIEQIEYGKKLGLNCTMIHCDYNSLILNNFWEDNFIGEQIKNDYISQIKKCGKLTKNFVIHLNGSKDCKTSEIGLNRIKQILKVCEKYNLNLCIENCFSEKEIPYVFKNINHPLLKICYDIGHINFLTKNFQICENFSKFIQVVHIHENNGEYDEHKKLEINSPIFNKFKKELTLLNKNIVLSSELKIKIDDWIAYLKENLKTIKKINNL